VCLNLNLNGVLTYGILVIIIDFVYYVFVFVYGVAGGRAALLPKPHKLVLVVRSPSMPMRPCWMLARCCAAKRKACRCRRVKFISKGTSRARAFSFIYIYRARAILKQNTGHTRNTHNTGTTTPPNTPYSKQNTGHTHNTHNTGTTKPPNSHSSILNNQQVTRTQQEEEPDLPRRKNLTSPAT